MMQPKTEAEILALPEGPSFGQETIEKDGRTYVRPVVPAVEVVWTADDVAIMAQDAEGRWWGLSKYTGGDYFRRRIYAV